MQARRLPVPGAPRGRRRLRLPASPAKMIAPAKTFGNHVSRPIRWASMTVRIDLAARSVGVVRAAATRQEPLPACPCPALGTMPSSGHVAAPPAHPATAPAPLVPGLIRGVPVPRAPGVRRAVLPSPDNALLMLTECPRDSPLRPWIRPSACLHALGHACGGSPGLWGVSRTQRSGTNYAEDHNHASSRQSCQKPWGCAGERLTGQRCFKQCRMLPHPRPALTRPTWSRFWATARLTTFSVSPCQGRKHLMYWSGQDTSGVRGTGLLTWR